MFKFRRKAVLAKIEATYGTDATPTGAADAVELMNVDITPIDAELIDRARVKPYLGNDPQLIAAKHVAISFEVPIAAAGAAGTAPPYGPLLRACGLAETINVAVDVAYDPVSDGEESASIYFYHASGLHKLLGCRGAVELQFNARTEPVYRFSLMGLFVSPSQAALPTVDLSNWQPTVPVSNANTPTFTLHGFAAVLEALSLNFGQQAVFVDRVNAERIDLSDRQPSGSVTIETPDLANKDFFAVVEAETVGVMQLVHGVGAGNIVQLDARVQLLNPRFSGADDIAMLELDLHPVPTTAGDDEFGIVVQ